MKEFDSEYCSVKYLEEESAVLLTWKKFSCGDNYRLPTTFALDLFAEQQAKYYIVDARHGFEDEKEDALWVKETLLPKMAKTSLKTVVFVMENANEIKEEMDMWTLEFGKYFTVKKACTVKEALELIKG